MKALTYSEKKERELAILQAAKTVLAAKGLDAITMDDVAREAGLAKGTLFLYYRSKDDLIRAIFISWVETLGEKFEALAAAGLPPERLLRDTVLALLDQFDRRRDITGYSIGMPVPGGRAELQERFAGNMKRIAAILGLCAEGGLLELEDPLFAASALFGLCRGSNTYARTIGRRLPVEERADRIIKIFLNGTRRVK
jgi:TetR/AcrR family fatty acid metabolism transcriptional regulator